MSGIHHGRPCHVIAARSERELLTRSEYLVAENRIRKAQLKPYYNEDANTLPTITDYTFAWRRPGLVCTRRDSRRKVFRDCSLWP